MDDVNNIVGLDARAWHAFSETPRMLAATGNQLSDALIALALLIKDTDETEVYPLGLNSSVDEDGQIWVEAFLSA